MKSGALLLLFVAFTGADHCVPGTVPNISLNSSYYLQWSEALNPYNCTISGYVINIYDQQDNVKLEYQTGSGVFEYDLNFRLDMCATYTFEVHALTDEFVLGPSVQVDATTAPTSDMDLSLIVSNITTNIISWNLYNSSASRCISYYRVVYWDEYNNPTDIYVPNKNFSLPELVPCMDYTIQINAIVSNPDLEGPKSEVAVTGAPAVPNSPKLVNMTTTNSSVNMFWNVPFYDENMCQLLSLEVYTIGVAVDKTHITVPISDSPRRPDVQVFVDGLSPNNVYLSYVGLRNVAGYSNNVTVSYQTSENLFLKYAMGFE